MKQSVFVIGTAVVDLIFQGEIFSKRFERNRLSLAYGGKYVVDNLTEAFGGGGANASVSLARQGIPVALWTKVAKDSFGNKIFKNLHKEGVKTNYIDRNIKVSPLSSILLDMQGRRTIINYRSSGDDLGFSNDIRKALEKFSWLALFSMPRWPKKEKIEVFSYARELGLKIFLSLHGDEYRKGLSWVKDYFKYCQVLDLNIHELSSLLDIKVDKLDLFGQNYAEKLSVPIVIVTHDKSGSHLYSRAGAIHQKALLTSMPVDATGAGDAFSSGFLGKYIKTGDLKKAMEFGNRNATAEIKVLGAQEGLLYDKERKK